MVITYGSAYRSGSGWSDDPTDADSIDALGLSVMRELPDVASRMIGKQPELFAAQDRLESEAEFREAIIPPLTGLAAVVVTEIPVIWIAPVLAGGLILGLLVFRRSSASRRTRNNLLIDAWYQGRVMAPTWEKLAKAAEKGLAGAPQPLEDAGKSEAASAIAFPAKRC
jgi:hypothetical protein